MKKIAIVLFFCGFLSSLVAQAPDKDALSSEVQTKFLQELLTASAPPFRLATDDIFTVTIYGIKEYVVKQRVPESGVVNFPFIGMLKVSGLSVAELERNIADLLIAKQMIGDPQVVVTVNEKPSSVITVSGSVLKSGIFPAVSGLKLIDYISQAGGLLQPGINTSTPESSLVVTLIRSRSSQVAVIDLGADPSLSDYARIPVFPGDEIRVKKMGLVYAVGAFKNQGVFALNNSAPTTVMKLIALAGGIGYEANEKDVRILRTTGSNRTTIEIDVKAIKQGKDLDVQMQNDDILFAPTSRMKASIKGGGVNAVASVASGIASALIYSLP